MNKKLLIGFVMTFLLVPLVFASPEILFYDGFESGNIGSYWTNSGGVTSNWTVETNPIVGTYNVEAKDTDGNAYLITNISTKDYRNIFVQFEYLTLGLDPDDALTFAWYDGNNWNTILNIQDGISPAETFYFELPTGANYNENFAIRLGGLSTASNDIIRVDEIYIFGTYQGEILPNSILGFMIMTGLFFITFIFVALTIHFDNEMKFVFFILIFISVAFNLNVMTQLGASSGLSLDIIHLLGVLYKVTLWLFMFIVFYSVVKLFLAMRESKKTAVETKNPNLSKRLPE